MSIDLTDQTTIYYKIYSSRTGENIKIGIHDAGGTTTEHTANINSTGTWELQTWDISGVSNANKDAIDRIIITIVNADAVNTFYIDDMFGTAKQDYEKNFTDDVMTISEPVFFKGVGKLSSETATLSEPTFIKAISRIPLDTVTLSEVYARTWALIREWTETATLSEPVFVKAVAAIFEDVATLSDEIKKATSRILLDTATLSEVFGRAMVLQRWVETVTLSEVAQRAVAFILSETITLSDITLKALSQSPIDTVTLSDVFSKATALRRWVETLTITDTIVKSPSKVFLDVYTLLEAINKWHLPAPKTTTWTVESEEAGMWTKEEAGIEWSQL